MNAAKFGLELTFFEHQTYVLESNSSHQITTSIYFQTVILEATDNFSSFFEVTEERKHSALWAPIWIAILWILPKTSFEERASLIENI